MQTRQDFTKNLINTLQTGADNLVLADTNEEAANLLALQTRQSLSTTALSLPTSRARRCSGCSAKSALLSSTLETAGPQAPPFSFAAMQSCGDKLTKR